MKKPKKEKKLKSKLRSGNLGSGKLPKTIEENISKPEDTPRKKFNFLKTKKSRFTLKYWKTWFADKYFASRTVMVNMELLNGMHDTFLVIEKEEGFHYKKKKFIFDNDAKYYNINARQWCYDYHEQFALPIKRKIPVSSIKSTLEASNISEVEYATNPSTLERFIVAKIAEGIMRGQELDEMLRRMMILLIIATIVGIGHFLLFAQKSGIFAQINIPGIIG